jgi:hypothetical protein
MADGNASLRPPHTHGADLDLALGQPCMLCASGRLIITVSVRLGGPQIGDDYLEKEERDEFSALGIPTVEIGAWGVEFAGSRGSCFARMNDHESPSIRGGLS